LGDQKESPKKRETKNPEKKYQSIGHAKHQDQAGVRRCRSLKVKNPGAANSRHLSPLLPREGPHTCGGEKNSTKVERKNAPKPTKNQRGKDRYPITKEKPKS